MEYVLKYWSYWAEAQIPVTTPVSTEGGRRLVSSPTVWHHVQPVRQVFPLMNKHIHSKHRGRLGCTDTLNSQVNVTGKTWETAPNTEDEETAFHQEFSAELIWRLLCCNAGSNKAEVSCRDTFSLFLFVWLCRILYSGGRARRTQAVLP